MAWPETCLGAQYAIKQMTTKGYFYSDRAWDDITDAQQDYNTGHDHEALGHIIDACEELHYSTAYLAYNWAPFYNVGPIWWYLEHCIEPSEVTMSAIIDAMDKALPHEPILFVGYLEAFKASCWNSSFDERFFADLIKKWSIWG